MCARTLVQAPPAAAGHVPVPHGDACYDSALRGEAYMTERKRGRQRDASGARFNGHGRTLNDLLPQRPLLPLRSHAERALSDYFTSLNGSRPADLYDLVLREVEEPLFRVVLDYAEGNQSRAAGILGINRGTLRKKLKQLGLAH